MVDAALAETNALERDSLSKADAPRVTIAPWGDAVAQAYTRFAAGKIAGAAQQPGWIETWAATQNSDILVVWMTSPTGGKLAFPLEVVTHRGATVARAIGGRHACGSFPYFEGRQDTLTVDSLKQSIRTARPDIDVLRIERLVPTLGGKSNPFAQLPKLRSPNIALAVSLEGGFPKILERVGRKRRMKRHRGQIRKYEAVGSFRRFRASTDAEVERIFEAFMTMKAERFRLLGVPNVFLGFEKFWLDLFKRSLHEEKPTFTLEALEVGDKLRAVTGTTTLPDRQICEFGAIADDELFNASPGDHLAFENIQEAAERGFAVYDFSVGDEHYKRQWCDIEIALFDIMVPLTAKGAGYALILRAVTETKRRIKSNTALWTMIKRLRRGQSAPARPSPPEDD